MKPVLILGLLLTLAMLPVAATAVGNISITSTPSGATIYLDGVPAGSITPATVGNVANGTHTVLLQLSGYQDYTQTNLQVNDNQTSMVSATLTNLTSSVSFYSVPAGATVYVDGVSRGTTNTTGVTVNYGSRTVLMTLTRVCRLVADGAGQRGLPDGDRPAGDDRHEREHLFRDKPGRGCGIPKLDHDGDHGLYPLQPHAGIIPVPDPEERLY